MRNRTLRNLITGAMLLALAWILPFIATLNLPVLAKRLSPMHIPILLCGFLMDAPWAAAVGFVAPLLRSVTVGMPRLLPDALTMAFELAAYALSASLLSRALRGRLAGMPALYAALIGSMLIGRAVWGLAAWPIYAALGLEYSFGLFLTAEFVNAVPAIVCHILIVPPIVAALRHTGMFDDGRRETER